LYVGGAGVARGYLNRPELTAEKFVPDAYGGEMGGRLYRTGDSARWASDGAVQYVARADTQLKVHGHRIDVGEIEAALQKHNGVRDCVVVAGAGGESGGHLIAYVVSGDEGSLDANDLRAFMKELVPEYMVPTTIIFLEQLPLTPDGVVDREALPPPDLTEAAAAHMFVAPRTELERTIAAVWASVLGQQKIGVNDNFFDLGGHSLLVAKVHMQLGAELDREIPMVKLFEHPTVASLAAFLNGEASEEEPPVEDAHEKVELRKENLRQRRAARLGHRVASENPEGDDD
jgi:acyl carrier protein